MSSYEYEIQTMLWKNMMDKVLIQTLNIGIKDKKNDAVLFKLPSSSKISIVATKNKYAAAPVLINKINIKYSPKYLFNKSGRWKGYPFRSFWSGGFTDGYSDHLPVYMLLVREL